MRFCFKKHFATLLNIILFLMIYVSSAHAQLFSNNNHLKNLSSKDHTKVALSINELLKFFNATEINTSKLDSSYLSKVYIQLKEIKRTGKEADHSDQLDHLLSLIENKITSWISDFKYSNFNFAVEMILDTHIMNQTIETALIKKIESTFFSGDAYIPTSVEMVSALELANTDSTPVQKALISALGFNKSFEVQKAAYIAIQKIKYLTPDAEEFLILESIGSDPQNEHNGAKFFLERIVLRARTYHASLLIENGINHFKNYDFLLDYIQNGHRDRKDLLSILRLAPRVYKFKCSSLFN